MSDEYDVLSLLRTHRTMVERARVTGDPLNELWALRADALRSRGLSARLEELDEYGHPNLGVPIEDLAARHGLGWANLRWGDEKEFARYGAMVVD